MHFLGSIINIVVLAFDMSYNMGYIQHANCNIVSFHMSCNLPVTYV